MLLFAMRCQQPLCWGVWHSGPLRNGMLTVPSTSPRHPLSAHPPVPSPSPHPPTSLPLCALQRVAGHGAAGQGLHAQGHGGLELGRAVDGQAQSQDQHQAGTGHAAGNLGHTLNVAQRTQLQAEMQATCIGM